MTTKDEIMIAFAASFETPRQISKEPISGETEYIPDLPVKTPEPIKLPEPKTPISVRDKSLSNVPISDVFGHYNTSLVNHRDADLIVDFATNHPERFLTGRVFPDSPASPRMPFNAKLVNAMMTDLTTKGPHFYFSWGLYKPEKVAFLGRQWIEQATKSFIAKDPMGALQYKISHIPLVSPYLIDLWEGVEKYFGGPKQADRMLEGQALNDMRYLAGQIAQYNPEYYMQHIRGRDTTLPRHDRIVSELSHK
jgi:hypothetical protein